MDGTLTFDEYRLSDGNTQSLPAVIEFVKFFVLTIGGDDETFLLRLLTTLCLLGPICTQETICETLTTFHFRGHY